jgi:tRNA nucleotidyltransferase (CCA-adding enzyme)
MQLITTHLNADFDALASLVAAKKLYPQAVASFSGSQESTVREFLATFNVPVTFVKSRSIDINDINLLVIVDTKHPSRIGRFSEVLKKKNLEIHIYDHHPFEEDDIRGQREIVEEIGAATTILTEILINNKVPISPLEATIFALGIYEETGSLIYPSTTERDLKAAAHLIKKGANLTIVSNFISHELNREEIQLLNDLVRSAKDSIIHSTKITIARAWRENYISDVANLSHKLREFEDTDVLVLIVDFGDRIILILRSKVPEVDVSEIARLFGGGGHPSAASATIKDKAVDKIEETIMSFISSTVRLLKTAQDIMTTPVKTINHRCTVKEAEQILTKYEINVLPVLKKNAFWGVISREIVEKALFHGFGSSYIDQFSTTDVQTVKKITPISLVEKLMIEQNQRFMPVIEGKTIKGAITRTDLLRAIYEETLRKRKLEDSPLMGRHEMMPRNLSSIINSKFPDNLKEILVLAGEVAEKLEFSAYLVGGSVRDLLRGEANLDIDIVIEGNGITFARALGKRLKAKVKSHARFNTAVVITENFKLDVATARTEFYEFPGALPTVETSSIKKDLYRRDFTINALAVKLNPSSFGELLDFFGGQIDIKEKTIKVLHNLSFIEDPTRAFRAVRFSERFGYKIGKHTLRLIKTAITMDIADKIAGRRLFEELGHIIRETNPLSSFKKLHNLGLLCFIHPHLKLSYPVIEILKGLNDALVWWNLLFLKEEIDRVLIFFSALIENLNYKDQRDIFKRLMVSEKISYKIITDIKYSKNTVRVLNQDIPPSSMYHVLKPLSIESLLLAMGMTKNQKIKQNISLYLTSLRKVKTLLTGYDLKDMGYNPGPMYKEILDSLLNTRLDGTIKTRDDEIAFVRENFPLK